MRRWMLLALAAWCLGAGPAGAQTMTPGPDEMTVIATSDEDGVPTPKLEATRGPLQVRAQMAGQWSRSTQGAQIVVQVQLTNASPSPVVLDEVRGDFKKGARSTDPTVHTDVRRRVVIGPGQTRSVWLGFDNPQRLERVSVDLALTSRGSGGRLSTQRAFLKGNQEIRYYERLDRAFRGLTPAPYDTIGTWPITTGPVDRWPSPYGVQMQPPNRGLINVGF